MNETTITSLKNKYVYERKVTIQAPIERVWEALTNPDYTMKYMFNCRVKSTWGIQDDITWKGNYMGYDAFQKGVILECQPMSLIKYSTFDPNFGYEDVEENYVHVTYQLLETDKGIDVIFKSDNFGDDQKRYEDTKKGWDTLVVPAFIALFK